MRISDWSSDVCSSDLFNSSGTLSDERVRQALAMALDKDSIRDIAYGGAGTTQWSPIPESSWAYAEQEGYEYHFEAAAAHTADAGESDMTSDGRREGTESVRRVR